MQPTDQLAHIVTALDRLVGEIDANALNNPTPCDKFTVHDVLDHMMVGGGTFAYRFRGEEAPELKAPPVYGRVPAAEFRAAMTDLLDAVRSPGAMERNVDTPFGEMPGDTFARLVAFDGLIHGWDLATATGLDYDVPSDVVEAVDGFARSALGDDLRDGDTFKDATTERPGADLLERLAAFSGRST